MSACRSDSEAIDFRVASEFFASVRKLVRRDLAPPCALSPPIKAAPCRPWAACCCSAATAPATMTPRIKP